MAKATDINGCEIKVGDVVTVVVKYVVLAINEDGSLLCHKAYDVPANAVKVYGQNLNGDQNAR